MAFTKFLILRRLRKWPSRGMHAADPAFLPIGAFALVLSLGAIGAAAAAGSHGLSLFGELKYGPEFKNFDYVNPNAPSGGTMKFSAIGTYDTLNPFVVKGVSAAGIGQIFDTLMVPSEDEAGSEYGLVAESVELA